MIDVSVDVWATEMMTLNWLGTVISNVTKKLTKWQN
jgi:hypothetical protein